MASAERRICWPEPDATCLEGGCIYCNDYPYRKVSTIRRYAEKAGHLYHRGGQYVSALKAFEYGERTGWGNVDSRIIKGGDPS